MESVMHRLDIPWLLEKFNDEEGETCEGVRSRMLSLSHLPSNVSSPLRLFAFRFFGVLGGGTSNLLRQDSLTGLRARSRVNTRQVLRSRSFECQVIIVFSKPTSALLSRHVLPHIHHTRAGQTGS